MIRLIPVFALFFVSTAAMAQETYKCKINGSTVFQDRPCPGDTRRSESMPPPRAPGKSADAPAPQVSDEVAAQRAKLEKDKAWLAERAKKREQEEAQDRIAACDRQTASIQAEIERVAAAEGPSYKPNLAGLSAMQLAEEQRQSKMAGLQSQVTAKRHECDGMRKDYDKKYR